MGFGAARFTTEGVPDFDFGTAGLAVAAFSTRNDFPAALAVDALGRIVVAGQASNQEQPDFAVARFLPGGSPDPSFFGDGELTVDFFGAADDGEALLVQPDGKIIVAGSARSGSTSLVALVRLVP